MKGANIYEKLMHDSMTDGCQNTLNLSVARLWMRFVRVFRSEPLEDQKRRAHLHAQKTITEMTTQEKQYQEKLATLAQRVKTMPRGKMNKDMQTILMNSKNMRAQLNLLIKKRQALESHLQTLQVSDLNTQILASVQETSSVLKNMGLDKNLDSLDEIMMDMKDSISDVNALQEGLSENINAETDDNDDLHHELELLLGEQEFISNNTIEAPLPVNTMPANPTQTVAEKTPLSPITEVPSPVAA